MGKVTHMGTVDRDFTVCKVLFRLLFLTSWFEVIVVRYTSKIFLCLQMCSIGDNIVFIVCELCYVASSGLVMVDIVL